jgi:hypothetical protein
VFDRQFQSFEIFFLFSIAFADKVTGQVAENKPRPQYADSFQLQIATSSRPQCNHPEPFSESQNIVDVVFRAATGAEAVGAVFPWLKGGSWNSPC